MNRDSIRSVSIFLSLFSVFCHFIRRVSIIFLKK
jgi:hypothetical protein